MTRSGSVSARGTQVWQLVVTVPAVAESVMPVAAAAAISGGLGQSTGGCSIVMGVESNWARAVVGNLKARPDENFPHGRQDAKAIFR